MSEFLTNLKQRKLVQWAVAYLAGAWALLQVLDLAASSYEWPTLTMRIAFGLIALGFVVTLLLAWYHGERGEQKVSGTELLLLSLILAVGGGLIWRSNVHTPEAPSSSRSPDESAQVAEQVADTMAIAAADIPAKSIAVLPFENLSEDKGNQYFADGMQQLILTKLSDIRDLKVISRTSTAKYKSRPDNLKIVAAELGVATILEGSVQKADNEVLINVQLIDANTDSHIWAQSYQRTLDNIFGVEGEVAAKVADALKAKLTATEARAIVEAPTRSQPAYDAYLRGLYHRKEYLRTYDFHSLNQSIELLQEAVKLDPNLADAYAQLASNYAVKGENPDEQDEAVQRALTLDPNNALAHQQLAIVLFANDPKAALIEAERSVQLQPNSSDMLVGLGVVLGALGRFDDSIVALRRAVALDPRVAFQRTVLAEPLIGLRRYAEARDALSTAMAIDPGDLGAVTRLAEVYQLGWGDLEAAHNELNKVTAPVATSTLLSANWYWQFLLERNYAKALAALDAGPAEMRPFDAERRAAVYQAQGDAARAKDAFSQARALLDPLVKARPEDALLHARLALIVAGLGQRDHAIEEAQRAVALRPLAERPTQGPFYLAVLAAVQARTGDTAAAIKQLDYLLQIPAGRDVSVPMLKLDPAWDPIRNDPRFQALLEKYADSAPAIDNDEVKP